jgi:predicted lysophospholipase L1 biosynthesis ABC-type transport system permease subunit
MNHLRFYFQHSINDMTRNGRRTLFALFCVAAGVAAIVALRTLGLSIGDTLTTAIAANNKGDLQIVAGNNTDRGATAPTGESRAAFSIQSVNALKAWAEARNIAVTTAITNVNISVAAIGATTAGRPQVISSLLIDPKVYPFYGPVLAIDPPNVPISQLFTGGNDIVVSENLAQQQKLKVGDKVRVGRTTEEFTVRGIAPTDAEGFRSILVLFFGYAYFDQASAPTLQLDNRPDEIYLKTPPGTNFTDLQAAIRRDVPTLNPRRMVSLDDARKSSQQIADIADRLIVAMGLIALLIGATGIIHTMLVVVRRRTLEIAVLKTLGVRGRQITVLFVVEALIMGVLGSLIGVVLGTLISFGVLGFAQQVWPATLRWRLYPEAILTGFILGSVVTVVFGFLPTLTAARVRPAVVLRPNEARLPATGCLQQIFALLIVVIGVGLIVGGILGNTWIGFASVAVTLVNMGICIGILWFVVLILAALPAFRSVDLRLALRGIGEHRFRTASTLFALIVGMFALSSITLISSSVPKLVNLGFQNALGGNVIVFTPIPLLRPLITGQLNTLKGVERWSQVAFYTGSLDAVNGDTEWASKVTIALPPGLNAIPTGPGRNSRSLNEQDLAESSFSLVSGQDVRAKGYQGAHVISGRPLQPSDSGKPVIVIRTSDIVRQLGLKPGDKLKYSFGSRSITFELVGLLAESSGFTVTTDLLSGTASVPIDSLPAGVGPTFEFSIAQVPEAQLNETLVALSALPGVITLDVGFIDSLIKKLINLFTVIPLVVVILSLFAGAVIIANTVSLATLERRQRIGVMKAIGMSGRRTLGIMVLENGIVGLVGGLIGVGVGVIATFLFSIGSGLSILDSIEWGYVGLLLLLSLGITMIATFLAAWTAVREKPLNVLRYE